MGRRTDPRLPISVGRSGTPVVYAFSRVTEPDALCLAPDDDQGACIATEHLIRQGRRRLAHITGPAEWQKRIASGEFKTIMMEEA